MPTMPASGAISSTDLNTVFGSDASFSSEDYYRGGAFVPSTKEVIGTWSAYRFDETSGSEETWVTNTNTNLTEIKWNGFTITSSLAGGVTDWLHTAGGHRYQRGSLQSAASPFQFYSLRRRVEDTESINAGVPTSGELTSSDWYGAENP